MHWIQASLSSADDADILQLKIFYNFYPLNNMKYFFDKRSAWELDNGEEQLIKVQQRENLSKINSSCNQFFVW